jgi:hypothetical protein
MAQFESILGDQSDSPKNKQNNVTEFSSPQSKGEASAKSTSSSSENRSESSLSRETRSGSGGTATATARSLMDQAKETAGQAYDAVTDKAANKLNEQKSTLSGGLTSVAESVRQVGENLGSSGTESGLTEAAAKYTNTAAQKLEDVAGYFETRNVREMARDLEGFARRNPAVFLGAAFGLGFIAARFLKSSTPKHDTATVGREFSASASNRESNPGSTPAF